MVDGKAHCHAGRDVLGVGYFLVITVNKVYLKPLFSLKIDFINFFCVDDMELLR